MPVKKNPGVNSGSGANSADDKTSFTLAPSGKVLNKKNKNFAEAQNDHPLGGPQSPLANHLSPNSLSHSASQITIDQKPAEVFDSNNVEGALDELSALIPPKPPVVGFEREYMAISGYPDWGVLKLNESSLLYRHQNLFVNKGNFPSQVYPYYWQPPDPAITAPFLPITNDVFDFSQHLPRGEWSAGGNDPYTDPMFNVADANYSGGGIGDVYSGSFTRDGTQKELIPTLRIYPIENNTHFGVVLSGMVFPADRGVLALVHYPEGGKYESFLGQSLDKKVVCAILLGAGILDDCPCDGGVGGIFKVGQNKVNKDYDPYSFPGQATGQGDLYEIHTGFKSGTRTVHSRSQSLYYNFDNLQTDPIGLVASTATTNPTYTTVINHPFEIGDTVTIQGHTIQLANGHRTITAKTANTFTVENTDGSVADAGGGTGGVVVRDVGCSKFDYTTSPYPGQVRLGTDPNSGVTPLTEGIPILGATSSARGGGDDNNFFRYRLPYLDNYAQSGGAGIKWTPSSEKYRYYEKPTISLDPTTDLTTAGNYQAFSKDYYPFQVARYRHRFMVDSNMCNPSSVNDGFDLGSYALIHFKKEKFFEEFVRDGVIPAPEHMYSMTGTLQDIEYPPNVFGNSTLEPSPFYHTKRVSIFGENLDGVSPPTVANMAYTISVVRVPSIMRVSGIAYFVAPFEISVTTQVIGLFENTYSDSDLSSFRDVNPAFYSVSAFSYSPIPSHPNGAPSFGVTAPTSNIVIPRYQRAEIPLHQLGYSKTNPPTISDTASLNFSLGFIGDQTDPSFSTDARLKLFFRRPIGHKSLLTSVLPYNGYSVGEVNGREILYSSAVRNGAYGNHQVNPPIDNRAVPSLVLDPDRFLKERFLDEVYRYDSTFSAITAADPILGRQLSGPGLPLNGSIKPIKIPVVAGFVGNLASPYLWADSSWLQTNSHLVNIGTLLELQVAGLPHRNPPLEEGVINPFPSRGILQYPQTNYTSNHRPSLPLGDISSPQFNYSSVAGERSYVRVFGLNQEDIGKSIVTLKIEGLELQDFQYSPPKGGSSCIAIYVKVPGLTTWLDIGRRDGDGPSKQDPLLDGAGCQVMGEDTHNGYDTENGNVYCYVKINVGSTASFFNAVQAPLNRIACPLMLKVVYYDTLITKFYNFANHIDPLTRLPTLGVNENAKTRDLRGLIGISVHYGSS